MKSKIVTVFFILSLLGCNDAKQVPDSGAPPKPSSDISNNPNQNNIDPYNPSNDMSNNNTQTCSTYQATECYSRGCELINNTCSQGGSFTNCASYSDNATCGKYSMQGCVWQNSGGNIPNLQQQNYGNNQPMYATGSCIAGNQSGGLNLNNNMGSGFNGLSAILGGLQCIIGECPGGLLGALSGAMQPNYQQNGMPLGGGNYNPYLPNGGFYQNQQNGNYFHNSENNWNNQNQQNDLNNQNQQNDLNNQNQQNNWNNQNSPNGVNPQQQGVDPRCVRNSNNNGSVNPGNDPSTMGTYQNCDNNGTYCANGLNTSTGRCY